MKKILLIMAFVISAFSFEELTIDNFESKIKNKSVVIDFYAVWCPPCKVIAKNLKEFDKLKTNNVQVYKVNIDEQKILTRKYGVKKLPTLIYFNDGIPVKTIVGLRSTEELIENSKNFFN